MADTQANTEPKKAKPPQGAPKGAKEGGEPKVKKPRERSDYVARLKTHFEQVIRGELSKQFGYKNRMQVPRVVKVVVNMGLGEAISNPKILDGCVQQLAAITGQKPVITRSRKAISNFKLRAGQQIGAMVTMRADRAW